MIITMNKVEKKKLLILSFLVLKRGILLSSSISVIGVVSCLRIIIFLDRNTQVVSAVSFRAHIGPVKHIQR